jgi:mannose-6-phosphate isomerase-like protein (cupin superfamily)
VENSIEKIEHNGKILAIVTRAKALQELEQSGKSMLFVSPDEFPFQVGIHNRPKGDICTPHVHIPFSQLTNFPVQEFFYIISGSVKIDLYNESENDLKISEVIVNTGDSIILNCGHGFTFLEDNTKVIELKQGPYRGRENEKRDVKEEETINNNQNNNNENKEGDYI